MYIPFQLVSEPRVRFEWEQWNRKIQWHRLLILEDANPGLPLWEEVASTAFKGETSNYER